RTIPVFHRAVGKGSTRRRGTVLREYALSFSCVGPSFHCSRLDCWCGIFRRTTANTRARSTPPSRMFGGRLGGADALQRRHYGAVGGGGCGVFTSTVAGGL